MSTTIQRTTAPEVAIALADDWEERMQAIEDGYRPLTDDQLIETLTKKLSLTAESFAECAILVRLAEERGIDTRPIANGMVTILRKIAYRQILPELVVYCSTNARLLQMATRLAIPEQRQLIQSWGLEFAEGDDCRLVDPRTATAQQLKQLFNEDRIRPVHEQRRWIEERSAPRRSKKFKPAVSRSSEVEQDDLTVRIQVGVTPEWDAAIHEMAKANGWPRWYAATRFLVALGKGESK